MNKREREEVEAAREFEGDATIGAGAGFGKYTREVSELRRRVPRPSFAPLPDLPEVLMTDNERSRVQGALLHVRNAMIANKNGAPVAPALEAAEKDLLRLLFSEEEISEYLQSPGAAVYR